MKIAGLVFFLCAPLLAQPRITNGTVKTFSSLEQAESAVGTGWIGYAMATRRPLSIDCGDEGISIRHGDDDDLHAVGGSSIAMFVRFQGGQIDKLRLYSPDCTLDASGREVLWVETVPPAASIAFLRRVVESGAAHARTNALLALSLYADGTDALIDIARHNGDPHLRGQALFWLAQAAGEKAAAALRDAVNNDPEESVRVRAVFGISQLPNDESIPMLVDLIEHNRSRKVRKQAAFWLGQKNDPRALAAIEEILRR